ncbi:MAG: ORF6N domain-containing protein [Verrucomicrobiota bacterium]
MRHEKVILDFDLAALYGVEARVLNQAVKRNRARFPDDFMFHLTPAEADEVRRLVSQSVTPAPGDSSNSSQIVMSSPTCPSSCPAITLVTAEVLHGGTTMDLRSPIPLA